MFCFTMASDLKLNSGFQGGFTGNKEDNENAEFVTDNNFTLAHSNETDIEFVRRPADDEKIEVSAVQKSFDEKIKECESENVKTARNTDTITNAFLTFRIKVISDYDKTPTRRHDTNQLTSMIKDKDSLKKVENKYDEQIHNLRCFHHESDKLNESIQKRQTSFTHDEDRTDSIPLKSGMFRFIGDQNEDILQNTYRRVSDTSYETKYPIVLSKDELDRVLLAADASCRIMINNKDEITESEFVILRDKVQYLEQATRTSTVTSDQMVNLNIVRESYLHIEAMFLSDAAKHDKEYQTNKEEFQHFLLSQERMNFGYHRYENASLKCLNMYLYSHEGERIILEENIFYKGGSLSKNIVVSGSTSNCRKFCEFLTVNCRRHKDCPFNKFEFEYVFRLSMRDVKETHIHDMIKNHILQRKYLPIFEQMLLQEANKCLIILEGLDQWKPFELDTIYTRSSTAQRNYQLPKRNHMTDYVVLVTTEDKNVENIKLGETDKVLYLKDSESDRTCNLF